MPGFLCPLLCQMVVSAEYPLPVRPAERTQKWKTRTSPSSQPSAVYDNGSGRTVVWVPDCIAFTYRFNPMKDSELGGAIRQTCDLPKGLLESQPWPIALTLIGDHRIENLAMQRKGDRRQNRSLIRGDNEEGDVLDEMEEREDSLRKEYSWREDRFGESPEVAYMRKETREEMLASMTDKQRRMQMTPMQPMMGPLVLYLMFLLLVVLLLTLERLQRKCRRS